jgi:uncharacterized protein YecE (DUF72 family)
MTNENENEAEIRIGTSGYSFLDWIGPFYPKGIERSKMFDFYVKCFNTVEINASYYSIPHPKVFENMLKKAPIGFNFFVKAHKSLTHDRKNIRSQSERFIDSVKPLTEAKLLKGILLQFPYSFKFSGENLKYVKRATDLFMDHRVIVEFRNRTWLKDEVLEELKQSGTTFCSVDEPALDGLLYPEAITTSKTGYIRFHGRNRKTWWEGGGERYDYLYNEFELNEWAVKIQKMKKDTKNIYVFFNNCHHGQAVKNARMMMGMLQENIGESA